MVMYATPTELAGFLQKDVDTYSATQALTLGSAEFSTAADTWWAPQSVTYATIIDFVYGVGLPYRPVTAVSQVRVNGSVVTGWVLRANAIYRTAGFGGSSSVVPNLFEADLTHGFTAATDDVKLASLEIAAGIYEHPDVTVQSEAIDDYRVTRYSGTPIYPGRPWREVAADYRGIAVA